MSRFAHLIALCAVAGGAMLAASASHSAPAAATGAARSFADLRDFDGVALAGPDSVVVTRGAGFSVRAEGDPRAIEQLDIYVRDNVLHVTRKHRDGWGWNGNDRGATVHVSLPMLHRATLAGSGDMTVDAMAGTSVEAVISGSGDLSIARIDAEQVRLALAGSGTLTAAGKVRASAVSIAGSGDVLADRLAALTTRVSIAGSGDAHVQASQQADVSIIGSGDAMIRGTSNCKLSKIGSGDAHCSV